MKRAALILGVAAALAIPVPPSGGAEAEKDAPRALTGQAAFGDWSTDAPGVRRHLTSADLPRPFATRAAVARGLTPRPADAWPKVPPGFKVEAFLTGLGGPRLLRTAPNGDIFVAETDSGRIHVIRARDGAGKPELDRVYAEGLHAPFGLAFYPPGADPKFLYVGTTDAVLRYPYRNGDLVASGKPETIVPELPVGGHWTRDVVFSPDGRKMLVAVGSASNDWENPDQDETNRADILQFNGDGSFAQVFASGLRNPVGLAFHPETGELWTTVNERDGFGDDLPPDYVTAVREGGFYGWPWYYIGGHEDPHHRGEHPELRDRVVTPDVLIQPHSAPLHLAVYTGSQFPPEYRNDIFVALHGSWNRARRTGYKLVRVLLRHGKPTGEYEDFMTGFVTATGEVWGRPVGVTVAHDGALLVSDDATNTVWRISYSGR